MATKYTLTTAFTAITETSGTIQNVGNELVELASSTNAVEGEGIVLNPSEKRSFKGALSARSMGDAGAVVNVVDFTEAGEGGEEYVLPVASDTTLGGIKISNSFTVANDGTLNIKKSGKTILGAVKSSDDEGKVTVNNDGTMTYNQLGYRRPSTTYEVGDIKYHSALPTGWYLECTTPGISSSGDLTISSPSIGDTVSDGTVVWTVSRDLPISGGAMRGNILYKDETSGIQICGGASLGRGATLTLAGVQRGNYPGAFHLSSAHKSQIGYELRGGNDGELEWGNQIRGMYDLAGSAIVAKSLGQNGYIRYASGLTMQWGSIDSHGVSPLAIEYPLAFSTGVASIVVTSYGVSGTTVVQVDHANTRDFVVNINNLTTGSPSGYIQWIAIGY